MIRRAIALAALFATALLAACSQPAEPTPTVEVLPTATPAPTSTPELLAPADATISPDGNRYAVVRGEGQQLVVGERGRDERQLIASEQISDLRWLPNSDGLAYVDLAPAEGEPGDSYQRVWIADLETGETHAIAAGFAPLLSPDGRHLAFIHGTRTGDACIVGYGLGIVELNDSFVPVRLIRQSQIAGIPADEQAHTFQPDVSRELMFPGSWIDSATLEVAMRWSCADPDGDNGTYVVEVISLQAEKR